MSQSKDKDFTYTVGEGGSTTDHEYKISMPDPVNGDQYNITVVGVNNHEELSAIPNEDLVAAGRQA